MNKDTGIEVKSYKLKALPSSPIISAVLFIKSDVDTEATPYVTDVNGVPHPLKGSSTITITNTDGTIVITGTDNVVINLSTAIKNLINSALQTGDNISELVNDLGYITIGDIPIFDPSNYDLEDFNNLGIDPYVHQSEITSGATNLTYTPSSTQGMVNSDTGTDAVIPLADSTNAGLLKPSKYTVLENTTNTNSGDQTSIVGIAGTKVQYNTSLTDGDFLFVGDITTYTDEEAQDAVGNILVDSSTIDFTYDDSTPNITAIVKPNSITSTELSNSINNSEFVNDSGYITATYVDGKVIDSIADGDTTHAPSRNSVFDALALKGDATTTTTQTFQTGVKTFLNGILGLRNTANTFTSFLTNTNTASRTYTLQDRTGTLAMLDDFMPQITITTSISITTATNDASGFGQKGRNSIIKNGSTPINITVDGGAGFVASYLKAGTGAITYVQGSGRTLISVDGTNVLNGAVGSVACISSDGTSDYLQIFNA